MESKYRLVPKHSALGEFLYWSLEKRTWLGWRSIDTSPDKDYLLRVKEHLSQSKEYL